MYESKFIAMTKDEAVARRAAQVAYVFAHGHPRSPMAPGRLGHPLNDGTELDRILRAAELGHFYRSRN